MLFCREPQYQTLSSCLRWQGICFPLRAQWCRGVGCLFGIDFKEVVEHDEEHGRATEEDGQRVERVVRDHYVGGIGIDPGQMSRDDRLVGWMVQGLS